MKDKENIKKEEILIFYNSVPYFLEEIKKRGYSITTFFNESLIGLLKKNIFRFCINDNLKLYNPFKKLINNKKVIILFAPAEESFIAFIKNEIPKAKIIYFYWNPAYRVGRPTEFLYKNTEIWTFDKNDAKYYNLNYSNTFYFDNLKIDNHKYNYDILFVGRNKHRKELLLDLKNKFEKIQLRTFFHIVPNRDEKNVEKVPEIKYSDYLELVASSKAILDICPPSQIGLTLRPMESLFFEKKLITNNENIVNEEFYNRNNILILNTETSDNDIINFLKSPYQPIANNIKKNYDFDSWIKRIIDNKPIRK